AVNKTLGVHIKEFTVAGFAYDGLFAHKWYIGCDDPVDAEHALAIVDQTLQQVNDDYAVERTSALKEVFLEVLPTPVFIVYMHHIGKFGAMNKFPRVMKGAARETWENFLAARKK